MRAFMAQGRRLKAATEGFKRLLQRLVHTDVYKTPATARKEVKLKRIADPTGQFKDYYYSERKGVDSLAFVVVDPSRGENRYLVLKQWHGPLSKFTIGAFTGSIDKDHGNVWEYLREELQEEAGLYYTVEELKANSHYKGKWPVGGNTNEQVHLFLVGAYGAKFEVRQPENIFEENMEMFFTNEDFIYRNADWKAIACLTAYDVE